MKMPRSLRHSLYRGRCGGDSQYLGDHLRISHFPRKQVQRDVQTSSESSSRRHLGVNTSDCITDLPVVYRNHQYCIIILGLLVWLLSASAYTMVLIAGDR